MKKLFLLLALCLIGFSTTSAQQWRDDMHCMAKYNIVGKGNSGQQQCSGTIYIIPSFGAVVKIYENGGFATSYNVLGERVLDSHNKVFVDRDTLLGTATGRNYTDVYIQICSNNPNIRFVCLEHYNSNGVYKRVVYKTTVVYE